MPQKLTVEIINNRISKENYVCLDYDITTKKFLYLCANGHEGSMRMNHWNSGVRCAECAGNKKLTYQFVKNQIAKEGYTLLSTNYTSGKDYLLLRCPKGHKYKVRWNNWRTGCRCPTCRRIDSRGDGNSYIVSGAYLRYRPENHHKWKGGVSKTGLPLYDTYAERLSNYHNIKKMIVNELEVVGVECAYCGKIYVPTISVVSTRLRVIEGKYIGHGERQFYCSANCKKACPTFGQKKYPKGFKQATSREVQPQLRKLVLERDNWICQKCGATETELHCHHITGIKLNPIESTDIDNCITLCKKCHKEVHKLINCGYNDLKCKN